MSAAHSLVIVEPPRTFVEKDTALAKRIGYYEGWAAARSCDAWSPSNINVASLTHINFAFASISSSFEVIEMTAGDSKLWTETTALKSQNPSLKVFLSIGGWSFNDPPTSGIFSSLVASATNTNVFIKSVLGVMNAYGFDGIDIDWEYPVADDRGGAKGDKENYVTFLKAVKAAFNAFDYGLSFTAPSSYWYLQNFDLPNMLADDAADWVNVMTYDLHGIWDSPADYIGSIVLAHTNLTEIMLTFQLYTNVGIDPSRMVMGIGFYGRSFQLVSDQCTTPGCPFAGAAPAGPCSANAGTLMFTEIEDIISSVGTNQLVFDEDAAVKYLVYNEFINWVSYDDQQTLGMKLQYTNSICLGGTMIWSVDQDDTAYTALSALYGDVTDSNSTDQITEVIGLLEKNPFTLETCTGIGNDFVSICCPVGDSPQSCTWRGEPVLAKMICNGMCNTNGILMGTSLLGDTPLTPCVIGQKVLCCKTDEDTASFCTTTACGVTTCPSGSTAHGSGLSIGGSLILGSCSSGNGATLCCEDQIGLTNCAWHGTPPSCVDNACPVGQTVIYNDYQGDASTSCVVNIRKK
ncbi:bacteriodes thetaiotaomicron symbiotic chitinase [Roridomyces roridus]|uniref:Bacteriodes thetaiotaomicron symbiotic chitinase n=1 Tax=Roridomyces roridus TaxID=1738132 RepID=A0AAD7C8R2_9AGAR|nr:bacteriodes thetaiotaomicron symbiotic chitinase [Roridomyces roridus]